MSFPTYVLTTFHRIKFTRGKLDQDMIDKEPVPRNTGFSLEWYFEDSTGKRVDIKQRGLYGVTDFYDNLVAGESNMFAQFINTIHTAVTVHNSSLDMIWNIARTYWLGYIRGETIQTCDFAFIPNNDIGQFLSLIIEKTSPEINIQDYSYNPQINDSFLETGFNIYHYVARCVDDNSINYFKDIMDIFKTDSHTNILEVSLQIVLNARIHQTEKDMWGISSAKKMKEKLQTLILLDFSKLDILSSKSSDLTPTRVDRITDDELKANLKMCLQNDTGNIPSHFTKILKNDTCKELRNVLTKFGKGKFQKPLILVAEQLYKHRHLCVVSVCVSNFFISAISPQLKSQINLGNILPVCTCTMHAHTDLACTAHSSTVHEQIFLKFEIMLSDNQTNTLTSRRATFVMCVHAQSGLACTANILGVYERIFLKFFNPV